VNYNPLQTFLQEAEELVADIEECALALTSRDGQTEAVNRLFRDFHTIKGSGAMCGLDAVAGFTHHVESLLDRVRDGEIPVSAALADLILKAVDHVKALLNAAQSGATVPSGAAEAILASILAFGSPEPPVGHKGGARGNEPASASSEDIERSWRISFRPNPALLANGGNPAALLRDLRNLGSCEVVAHTDEVPTLDAIRPDHCYFWWSATLRSACGENAIRDVFLFVEDESKLEIEEIESAPAAEETSEQARVAASSGNSGGEAEHPRSPRQEGVTREATVRVPAERLDRLVNLVGEFVMSQSCLAQAVAQNGAPEFANSVQALERLVAELRDNVLGIRMLPIGTLFGRFRRVVHDLSVELGKEADLVTEGAETELDKSILDQLGDPLVHCLRNCIDHAIEPSAERLEKGKPGKGTIRLSAAHTGANVVISIEDDGRGIDREAVRAKALEKRLIAPNADLTGKDIINLILLPGFSTARQVTSVSGRGVGMDVVKRQIEILRGSLSIDSVEGRGTRVSITLPLTLAIIDGLLVQIGSERFVLPLAAVMENVELNRADRARNNGRNVLPVRGDLIPYIDLRRTFDIGGEAPNVEKVVIVQQAGDRVGLVVERVVGTHQTVIQSLGKFYRNVEVVSGATIMGDGRVALILDIAAVVRHANRECQMALPAVPIRTERFAAQ
jgi:two-component system, chemotaxis family, sensor kinase CheA